MLAVSNPYQKYKEQSVNTATPEELTLMLYDGCIKFMNIAKVAIEEKKIEMRNTNIQKAQAIITELSITLNMDVKISEDLSRLYDFVQNRLLEANISNDLQALEEAKMIVGNLRDTWKEAMKIARSK